MYCNFDSDTIFTKETENTYVDIELIKTDADIIFEFMKSINIENLLETVALEIEDETIALSVSWEITIKVKFSISHIFLNYFH